jgi:hypothetical protein
MDSISSALAVKQAAFQIQMSTAVLKMAVQSDQQVAAMIAQAGQAQAANPPNLGQNIDILA